jgi:hypothetical protein
MNPFTWILINWIIISDIAVLVLSTEYNVPSFECQLYFTCFYVFVVMKVPVALN